jgi:hypothetical protein
MKPFPDAIPAGPISLDRHVTNCFVVSDFKFEETSGFLPLL